MGREVLVIQNRDIYGLNISPLECVKWVDESFRLKALAQLPPKMSVHPQGNDFLLNAMLFAEFLWSVWNEGSS